jgi:membrane associated rhomboid family serine protease
MSSSDPNASLPPNNPVLTAYEGFVRDTPLVSRYIMTTIFVTWCTSFFIDLNFSLSNIPYFSLSRLELYRILLSPLVCSNLLSLAFAYFSFVDHGKRLEFSMGSAQFAWLFFSLGVITNVSHILLTFGFYLFTGDRSWIFIPASGIWTVLFALIAIECVKAPPGSMRKLFMFAVPTLHYPIALAALFSLLGGIQMSNFMSLGVGYAYGYGYLEKSKVSDAQAKLWEDTIFANFARREGWVVGHAATGSSAWNDLGSPVGGDTGSVSQCSYSYKSGEGVICFCSSYLDVVSAHLMYVI